MKIYISVDIEGITGVTNWNETILGHSEHKWAADQMEKETIAACEAAIEMGAEEILIKDGHDSGRNIDINKLPEEANVIRGWTYSPESMMAGIDESFDASIFIGYHSASARNGNPLAHTMNYEKTVWMKINDEIASEFTLNTFISQSYGVPVVFLSGDKMICDESKILVPNIETLAVKNGEGGATFNIHPKIACRSIKEGVMTALENIDNCRIELPNEFKLEIRYKDHKDANRARYYPGVKLIDDCTIEYKTKDVQDLITARMFIL